MRRFLLPLILMILILVSCTAQQPYINDGLITAGDNKLTANDLKDIVISAPEGSGGIRTLTIRYMRGGKEETAAIDKVKRIDLDGYDDEKKEQVFDVADYDRNGIFYIIVYREFWFPDIDLAHVEIPEWPAVYEFDYENGFTAASSKHKDYFDEYAKTFKEQSAAGREYMSDAALLALSRLIYAAERVADGSFKPESPYNGKYYEDVYELTKNINE